MRKKFLENFSFLLVANLLIKPIWIFGIDRKVQIITGPEEYGSYFAAANFSFLFSVFLDLGINNFANRAVSRSPKRAGNYLSNLLRIKAVLGLLYMVATTAVAFALGLSSNMILLVLILSMNQLILSLILHFRAYLAALHHFKTDSLISVADKLLAIILVASGWMFFTEMDSFTQILSFSLSQTTALTLTAITAFLVLQKYVFLKSEKWSSRLSKAIFYQSFPFALLMLQMAVYGRLDGILLNRLLPESPEETGIYAAGFRLLDAATQFGYLSATVLLPLFARGFRANSNLKPLVSFSALLIFLASGFLALISFFFSSEIVLLLYHVFDVRYSEVLSLLMFAFIPLSSVYVTGTLLTAHGSMKTLNIIAFSGILVNVISNLMLIPEQGAVGAAKATLITQLVVAVAHAVAAFRLLNRKVQDYSPSH